MLFSFSCFSQEFSQNKAGTSITFQIKNLGFNVDGNFTNFSIKTNFNATNLEESFIHAEINVNSIFTDSKSRDKHLLKKDFFDVKKYPKIVFNSKEIQKIDDTSFLLIGFLTIKGIKKEVQIPVEIKKTADKLKIKGAFLINRKDFNVGGSSLVLSKTVKILVVYVGKKS